MEASYQRGWHASHHACHPREEASIQVGLGTKTEKSDIRCRHGQTGLVKSGSFKMGREEMVGFEGLVVNKLVIFDVFESGLFCFNNLGLSQNSRICITDLIISVTSVVQRKSLIQNIFR